jgi:serine protease Do
MKRSTALSLSVASALVCGLALGSEGVRAGERDVDETNDGKKIERRIEIVRFGGGALLGVGLEDADDGTRGAKVRSVEPDGAAAKAGIEDGDVITRFDGESVRSARQLTRLVRETPVGRSVEVEVKRQGATKTLTATLGEGPHRVHEGLHLGGEDVFVPDTEDFDLEIDVPEGLPHAPGPHVFRWHGPDGPDFTMPWAPGRPRLGIRFLEIEGQLAEYFGLSTDEGVLVSSVGEDTPAAKAGIRAGDLVLELDGRTVRDGRDLTEAVGAAESGRPVTVTLLRDAKTLEVEVVLPEPEKPKKLLRHTTGVSL